MPEELVGTVTHYFGHIQVAAVKLDQGLHSGDTIHIKGHTSDFTQRVGSMQLEHETIEQAAAGQEVAIKMNEHARQHDQVFKVI